MSTPRFYIQDGVRRAVAAREAGLLTIPAILREPGRPDQRLQMPLDELYSPKSSIQRDYRYIRYTEYPTKVLKTEPPPILIEPLGLPGQLPSVPLSQVALT